jgi:uncharacterized repeat protein (TIGR03803 family)
MKLRRITRAALLGALAFLSSGSMAAAASFTTLHHFNGTDGRRPTGSLTLGGSTLYGATLQGGSSDSGSVFRIDPGGSGFQTLLNLSAPVGTGPRGGLLLESGVLYGAAGGGTSQEGGALISVNTSGGGGNFWSFQAPSLSSGYFPNGDLIRVGSSLAGTASSGGTASRGTIWVKDEFGPVNHFSLPGGTGGASTPMAGLVSDGTYLYGTASAGGSSSRGVIFRIGTDLTGYQVLHNFTGSSFGPGAAPGRFPTSQLMLVGGKLYGTSSHAGNIFSINTDGTDFEVLHFFNQPTSTDSPAFVSELTLAGGTLYGTASRGGANFGSIFSIKLDGSDFQTLHTFASGGAGGNFPNGGLVFSNNVLYGTTEFGGQFGNGTVFALAVPEPSSIVLAAAGLAAILVLVIRGRRKRP